MSAPSDNLFNAADAALGYLFQCRLALLESIKRIRSATAEAVSIEALDDISFEASGTPTELLQAKHHATPAILTDSSSDIWKTLRVWMTYHRENKTSFGDVALYLITTASAPDDSIASNLGYTNRNPARALELLQSVAESTTSATNAPAADAFRDLHASDQLALVSSMHIVTQHEHIANVREAIKRELILNVREEHLEFFAERVEGWWFHTCVQHLRSDPPVPIFLSALHRQLVTMAEQFEEENLPIDLWDESEAVDIDNDSRIFVHQLRDIGLTNRSIELAVRNYYRAFTHRSRWNREDLLFVGELEQYERKLVEEWEEHFEIMRARLGETLDNDLAKAQGVELYQSLTFGLHIAIRPKVTEQSIYRGTLHILADGKRIGWHCSFRERLLALLEVATK